MVSLAGLSSASFQTAFFCAELSPSYNLLNSHAGKNSLAAPGA